MAFSANVNLIALAWEGREEADYELQATILRAAGIQVPARLNRQVPAVEPIANRLKAWAAMVNRAHQAAAPAAGTIPVVKPK